MNDKQRTVDPRQLPLIPIVGPDAILTCKPEEDRTRQEDRPMTEVANILARHNGQLPPNLRIGGPGETNYDLELTDAIGVMKTVGAAWMKVPPDIKAAYPTWDAITLGLHNGKLVVNDNGELAEAPPPAPPKGDNPVT